MMVGGAKRWTRHIRKLSRFWNSNILMLVIIAITFFCIAYIIIGLEKSWLVRTSKDPLPFVVAICGLAGTVLTGIISIIGLALKRSIDERTTILQKEAETRLRTESAMKAIEMMTAAGLDPVAVKDRRQGAIVALISIGQMDFALSMMDEYISQGALSTRFAVRIIDQAFRGHDNDAKLVAASLLDDLSEKLSDTDGSYRFPDSMHLRWNMSIPPEARKWVLNAKIKCLLSKGLSEWKSQSINQFSYSLYKIVITDDDDAIRYFAAMILKTLCNLPEKIGTGFMPPDRQSIHYSEMEAEVEKLGDVHDPKNLYLKIAQDSWDYHKKTKEWADKRTASD